MAYGAIPGPLLLLHALEVVIPAAVNTKKRIFLAAHLFFAKTDTFVRQVIDVVHLGAVVGLFVIVGIVGASVA